MRSSFFITSGENQILYIVQCFGLALFVQLVEVVQQGSLGGGIVLPRWCCRTGGGVLIYGTIFKLKIN